MCEWIVLKVKRIDEFQESKRGIFSGYIEIKADVNERTRKMKPTKSKFISVVDTR